MRRLRRYDMASVKKESGNAEGGRFNLTIYKNSQLSTWSASYAIWGL